MKRTFAVLVVLTFITGLLAACGDRGTPQTTNANGTKTDGQPAATGTVAVINLEEVFGAMGWKKEIETSLNSLKQQWEIQVNSIRNQSAQDIKIKSGTYKDPPTPEQQKELETLQNGANTRIYAASNQANQELNNLHVKMVVYYREQLQPYARRVAKQRGLSVVLAAPADQILSYDQSLDITQGVIDELQKSSAIASFTATTQPAPPPGTSSTPGR